MADVSSGGSGAGSLTRFVQAQVVGPDQVWERDLLVDGQGVIQGLPKPGESVAEVRHVVDCGGAYLYPGIIDILTHGFGHYFYADAEEDCLAENSRALAHHGVTGFVPSFISMAEEKMLAVLRRLASLRRGEGARVLGLHSEGPCLASSGAHPPKSLQQPSQGLALRMIAAAGGQLKLVTLAPELPGAREFIAALRSAGVGVHMGHTRALPGDVSTYASWGVEGVTHIYDVFEPAAVAEPGVYPLSLADAILAEARLALGLICDGVHAHPQQVRLLTQLRGDRLFLETDSMKFTGLSYGRFELSPGVFNTTTADRAARTDDGTLAGSALTPDAGLRNLVKFSGIDLPRASRATSLLPARLLKEDQRLGSLEQGKLADMILLDAVTLEVRATWVGGREAYRDQEEAGRGN